MRHRLPKTDKNIKRLIIQRSCELTLGDDIEIRHINLFTELWTHISISKKFLRIFSPVAPDFSG